MIIVFKKKPQSCFDSSGSSFLPPVLTDGDWCSSPRPAPLWVKEARGPASSEPITAALRLHERRGRPIGARACHRSNPPISNGTRTTWRDWNVCVRKLKENLPAAITARNVWFGRWFKRRNGRLIIGINPGVFVLMYLISTQDEPHVLIGDLWGKRTN